MYSHLANYFENISYRTLKSQLLLKNCLAFHHLCFELQHKNSLWAWEIAVDAYRFTYSSVTIQFNCEKGLAEGN